MKHYTEVYIRNISEEQQNILIALLENIGFGGFETEDTSMKAFFEGDSFDKQSLDDLAKEMQFEYSVELIEEQNWNALWESNFEPVTVDDFVTVRANFHPENNNTKYDIVITPKMSFGTGHHATTYMMMQQMRNIDFQNKSVFDFGTGTGVLAILAEILGAKEILAADIDDWSVENAQENLIANGSKKIEIIKAENASVGKMFDVVLANINKNVISDNAETINQILEKENGILLLSGLLKEDEADILAKFSEFELKHLGTVSRNQWICILYGRK